MGQISLESAKKIYGKNYNSRKIWLLNHSYNEGRTITRCLRGAKELTKNLVVLVDTKTTDKTQSLAKRLGAYTEPMVFRHNYSRAKQQCQWVAMQKCGAKFGDWFVSLGGDMELMPECAKELLEFSKDPTNIAAKMWVPDFTPDPNEPYISRARCLFWRFHPLVYFERLVHEEMVWSLYRKYGFGIPFLPEKEIPILGGTEGVYHHAPTEDTPKEKKWKRDYYLALLELDVIIRRRWYGDSEEGMLKGLAEIFRTYDVYYWGLDKAIKELTKVVQGSDVPKGLIDLHLNQAFLEGKEYDW